MKLVGDLHVHSCLSPCASLRASPAALVRRAVEIGLQVLALTDHNTARHVPVMDRLCREAGILFVPGIEVCTAEEIHVLCYFPDTALALRFGDDVYRRLPPVPYDSEKLGDQPIVDESDVIVETLDRYLGLATDLPLTDLCRLTVQSGGIPVPAHVDRPAHGLLHRLGYVPPLLVPTLEVSRHYDRRTDPAGLARFGRLISGSDAHDLEEVGTNPLAIDADTATAAAVLAWLASAPQ